MVDQQAADASCGRFPKRFPQYAQNRLGWPKSHDVATSVTCVLPLSSVARELRRVSGFAAAPSAPMPCSRLQ
jgi:hypothetical protein